MQRAAPTDVHLVLDKYLSLALRAPLSLLRCFPLLSNGSRLSLQIFLSAVSATFISSSSRRRLLRLAGSYSVEFHAKVSNICLHARYLKSCYVGIIKST